MLSRLRAAGEGFAEDQASQMGAAVAYYALFSLTPLLMLSLGVMGMMFGEAESREHIMGSVREYADPGTAQAIAGMLDSFQEGKGRVVTSALGIASMLFGATGMFTSLRSSMGRVWRLDSRDGVVVGVLKSYLTGVLMIFLSCAFFVVLLLGNASLPHAARRWGEQFPGVPWSAPAAQVVVSTLALVLLFVFSYRFLSDGRLPYSSLWGGALVSALLVSVGKVAIGHYLAYADLGSAFGAAGSVVLILAWVYYTAQIVFFGAEVIRAGLPQGGGRVATRV